MSVNIYYNKLQVQITESRNDQQVERDRTQLLVQTMKELNTQYNIYNRRASNTPPLAVSRVKVFFKDEPGEGAGVTRSFYTAIAEVRNKLKYRINIISI